MGPLLAAVNSRIQWQLATISTLQLDEKLLGEASVDVHAGLHDTVTAPSAPIHERATPWIESRPLVATSESGCETNFCLPLSL